MFKHENLIDKLDSISLAVKYRIGMYADDYIATSVRDVVQNQTNFYFIVVNTLDEAS